jgi:hypothetical protein
MLVSFHINYNEGVYLSLYPSYKRLLSFPDCNSYTAASACITRASYSVQKRGGAGLIDLNSAALRSGGSSSKLVSSL